jgi:hypothetical protein
MKEVATTVKPATTPGWHRKLVAQKFDGSRQRKRTTTWTKFICAYMDVLIATDFFTAEVWTWGELMWYGCRDEPS